GRESSLDRVGADVAAVPLYIREDGTRPGQDYAARGCEKRTRRDDHIVARPDAPRTQGELERHGAVGQRDRTFDAAILCIFRLDLAHFCGGQLVALAACLHGIDGLPSIARVDRRGRHFVQTRFVIHLLYVVVPPLAFSCWYTHHGDAVSYVRHAHGDRAHRDVRTDANSLSCNCAYAEPSPRADMNVACEMRSGAYVHAGVQLTVMIDGRCRVHDATRTNLAPAVHYRACQQLRSSVDARAFTHDRGGMND